MNWLKFAEVISDESCGLSEMDNLMAIHGIFSKDAISIDLISTLLPFIFSLI